jgi:hypothetical protein
MSNCPPLIILPKATGNLSNATLVSKQIINSTGTFRGGTGPTGATGARGSTGPTGATGPANNVDTASPSYIQFGSVDISGTLLPFDNTTFTGSFPVTFSSKPTMVCSIANAAGLSASLSFLDEASFQGYVFNTTNVTLHYNGAVQWFALTSL